MLKLLANYADFLGLSLFLVLFIYFYNRENKNTLEYCLMILTFLGFIFDVAFSYIFMTS